MSGRLTASPNHRAAGGFSPAGSTQWIVVVRLEGLRGIT